MKYTKFIIKNYKGIPDIELDLTKKPKTNIFTLVGLNESGKTTLLEAIYLFKNEISKEDAHTLIPKSQQYSFDGTVSVKAELELNDTDLQEIIDYLKNNYSFELQNPSKIIQRTLKYHFKNSAPDENKWRESLWNHSFAGKPKRGRKIKKLIKWDRKVWKEVIELIKEKTIPRILYYPNFLFEFPEKIYLEEYEGEGKEQEEYRKILQDILSSIDNKLTVEGHILERMRNRDKGSHKQALEALLSKMSAKLNEEILKKWDTVFKGTQPKEMDMSAGTESNFIELKIKQGSENYSINDRSLGFRWFFSFLIFTAFRKSRIEDPGETLFLLDEPASNLHQSSQKKLLDSLENIVSDCKLIYSTHSHHLINPKWLAGTYIVKNKAINYNEVEDSISKETNITATLYKNFVAQYPKEDDHFKPILDALDWTPSHLEIALPIIFTEGKTDYYIFKYMMSVICEKKYNLNFYPGAGVDKYEDPFRLYLAWNKYFVALFDSDTAGLKAKEQYIKKIGCDITDKIFTLEDINPNWKDRTTESLFSEDEKNAIIQSCFENYKSEKYDKSKFNTAIQQLYISKEKIDFSPSTLDNFKQIFDFISNKLSDQTKNKGTE